MRLLVYAKKSGLCIFLLLIIFNVVQLKPVLQFIQNITSHPDIFATSVLHFGHYLLELSNSFAEDISSYLHLCLSCIFSIVYSYYFLSYISRKTRHIGQYTLSHKHFPLRDIRP